MNGYFQIQIERCKFLYFFDTKKLEFIIEHILNDEYSKNLYLSAVINQISNYKGFLIVLFYDRIWHKYKDLALAKSHQKISSTLSELYLFDLSKINIADIRLYYVEPGIFNQFVLQQYKYRDIVFAQNGDYVIDGGACYGETTLYFSHLVGKNGKVFSFEFMEQNIEIFHKNMALNPQCDNITLVKRPLYVDSNTFVSFSGGGSSATIIADKQNKQDITFQTISIDDFVEQNKIPKIDFIKFDIEGAELNALKGGVKSIKKFRPKLAICLYHSCADYVDIPLFLHELLTDYEFYFDHFTLGRYESILFARPKPQNA
ncbi:FkbM family methyltransferase [Helicobacter typhlonius]|uniref:FkbM family methyltransferase n=1 Tax=Helicobacter typhlonius TaxID=76936 RepID=UPI002FDFE4F3